MHLFAFHYGFSLQVVLKLTRRQIVCYLENLTTQLKKDHATKAKLHGFKVKAPVSRVKWTKAEDKRFEELANRRYEEMKGAE